MAAVIISLLLVIAGTGIGFAVGFLIGERRGRRAVQQGFPVMPASKDAQ